MGGLQLGLTQALSEITLVLFTTLAPAGAFACFCMCIWLIQHMHNAGHFEIGARMLALPIVVSLVGLVASATHLGSPSNALYVLAGVGRSPLSNEVVTGAVFLGFVGSFWFYSFTLHRHQVLERVWLGAGALSALVFIVMIARAYQVDTIVTWGALSAQVALVASAVMLGGMLTWVVQLCARVFFGADAGAAAGAGEGAGAGASAGAGMRANTDVDSVVSASAHEDERTGSGARTGTHAGVDSNESMRVVKTPHRSEHVHSFAAVGALGAAALVWVVAFVCYMSGIASVRNEVLDIGVLIPFAPLWATLAIVLVILGVVSFAVLRLRAAQGCLRSRLLWCVLSLCVSAAGIFVGRFLFYMAHMTVGISY